MYFNKKNLVRIDHLGFENDREMHLDYFKEDEYWLEYYLTHHIILLLLREECFCFEVFVIKPLSNSAAIHILLNFNTIHFLSFQYILFTSIINCLQYYELFYNYLNTINLTNEFIHTNYFDISYFIKAVEFIGDWVNWNY